MSTKDIDNYDIFDNKNTCRKMNSVLYPAMWGKRPLTKLGKNDRLNVKIGQKLTT